LSTVRGLKVYREIVPQEKYTYVLVRSGVTIGWLLRLVTGALTGRGHNKERKGWSEEARPEKVTGSRVMVALRICQCEQMPSEICKICSLWALEVTILLS